MSSSQKRKNKTIPQTILEEHLEARAQKVILVRRLIVAELRAIEDRAQRLAIDVRRLFYPQTVITRTSSREFRAAVLRASEATAEVLGLLDLEGIEEDTFISKADMLRVFVGAVDFVRDAGDALVVCEKDVREREVGVRREGGGLEGICVALGDFPRVEMGLKGRVKGK